MAESVQEDHVKRVERELAKEDSLLANMIEQAPGMLGMALMFVVTIVLAMWLQPWFNSAGLQAFGESGSTQARWVVLELAAIFLFTFLILWLAKKHLQKVIKYGILFVIFLALCYTTVPGAHILLVPDVETEPFVFTEEIGYGEELKAISDDGSMLTQISTWPEGNNTTGAYFDVTSRASDFSVKWTTQIDAFPGEPNFNVVDGIYGYTITNGAYVWTVDKDTGDVLSKYACFDDEDWNGTLEDLKPNEVQSSCVAALEIVEYPEPENIDNFPEKGAVYIFNSGGEMLRFNTYWGTNQTSAIQGKWAVPQMKFDEGLGYSYQHDDDSFLVSSKYGAVMIVMEEHSEAYQGEEILANQYADPVKEDWNYTIPVSDDLVFVSALNVVPSPWDADEEMIIIGTDNGDVLSWVVDDDADGDFEKEDRFRSEGAFEGKITAIESFDLTGDGNNELWIADSKGIHGLFHSSLIEYATLDVQIGNNSRLVADGWTIKTLEKVTVSEIDRIYSLEVNSGEFDPDTMYNIYGIQWSNTAFLIGMLVSIALMAGLMWKPEWYIVNTVGILVGAGVIVMLGVTFVPTLIVIFMVLAAVYDAWAVYKSKHMLDLADTMIGLNLPILLVAPQESGYSMLDEQDPIREAPAKDAEKKSSGSETKLVKKKKTKEAMFMGLGDVIFPGMLVISCLNSIPEDGLLVGISALIGGLVGYLVLMGYVASGRPQAGLPLLNGGAILGYIIGGLIFVGSAAFSFGISF